MTKRNTVTNMGRKEESVMYSKDIVIREGLDLSFNQRLILSARLDMVFYVLKQVLLEWDMDLPKSVSLLSVDKASDSFTMLFRYEDHEHHHYGISLQRTEKGFLISIDLLNGYGHIDKSNYAEVITIDDLIEFFRASI